MSLAHLHVRTDAVLSGGLSRYTQCFRHVPKVLRLHYCLLCRVVGVRFHNQILLPASSGTIPAYICLSLQCIANIAAFLTGSSQLMEKHNCTLIESFDFGLQTLLLLARGRTKTTVYAYVVVAYYERGNGRGPRQWWLIVRVADTCAMWSIVLFFLLLCF